MTHRDEFITAAAQLIEESIAQASTIQTSAERSLDSQTFRMQDTIDSANAAIGIESKLRHVLKLLRS